MRMELFAASLVGAVAGAAVASGVHLALRDPKPAPIPVDPQADLRAEIDALRRDVAAISRTAPAAMPIVPVPALLPAAPDVAGLLPAGTPPARVAEAEARARAIRAGAEAHARNAEAAAARETAADMEREKRFLDDKARGGTMETLRGLQGQRVHLPELVADPDRFARLFARQVQGPVRTDADWNPREPFEDGTTVTLAAGNHSWDSAGYQHRKSFPKDVLLKGAGMNATLLRLNEIESREEVTSLAFEDLTIDCSNSYFSDLRSKNPVTIRMTRCRVVGFDMAAGGSVMLAAETAAFYAVDCRFEAGYSRVGPGSGNLFRVRDGLLVRMENCVVRGPFRSVWDSDDNATYLFSKCRFEDMSARSRGQFDPPPAGIVLADCTFAFLEEEVSWDRGKPRSLSDFNPAWK